ncbi:MAG: YbhB/YbcL family Raf kinase inhibitor-like protein [Actinomycetota bacterium]|jgi:Raf kinase inhibitor-like YbhB/YbcL family protein|nr:YbhB/YbcL family Raf kinase inhibitor-like protein [Actinomycetota bacterium]
MADFRLVSPAFEHDRPLPSRFVGEDEGVSPPLQWSGVPAGAKELLIVCDDPDTETGVVTHWIVFGIAPDAEGLPEGLSRDAYIEDPIELVQGLNEFDEVGYIGPEPDDERGPHRIFFRISALDAELTQLSPGATRNELRAAIKGHLLGGAELVGIA